MNATSFFWGMIFGCFGLGYFVYGKKQQRFVPLLCGLGLMVFPYFVGNTIATVVIGVVLMLVPYFARGQVSH